MNLWKNFPRDPRHQSVATNMPTERPNLGVSEDSLCDQWNLTPSKKVYLNLNTIKRLCLRHIVLGWSRSLEELPQVFYLSECGNQSNYHMFNPGGFWSFFGWSANFIVLITSKFQPWNNQLFQIDKKRCIYGILL